MHIRVHEQKRKPLCIPQGQHKANLLTSYNFLTHFSIEWGEIWYDDGALQAEDPDTTIEGDS